MINIKEKLIPEDGDRRGKREEFGGVTIHNTGLDNVPAKNFAKVETENPDFIKNSVSYHYVIDDVECYRLLPEDEMHFACRDGRNGKGNSTTISIEICEVKNILAATNRAAELTADILYRNNKTKQDIGNFVYQHNHWCGKNCPRKIRNNEPFNWESFLLRVEYYFNIIKGL